MQVDEDSRLVVGEVHTGLLQHSASVPLDVSEYLLAFSRGEPVRRFQRPIAAATSPDLLTGVDCRLPTGSGARVRGVGTVRSRAVIVGGHLLQGSSVTTVAAGRAGRRLPWSHYLARPGRIETIGRTDWTDLAGGFAAAGNAAMLDLAAISARAMDAVQAARTLDRTPPVRAARTRLRWVVRLAEPDPATGMRFGIEGRALRTLSLTAAAPDLPAVVDFCEDLARHDWLLTTLLEVLDRSRLGAGPPAERLASLRPAIDHLLHLWMPGARADETATGWWQGLERGSGLSRQWRVSVDRIRDQLAAGTIALLGSAARDAAPGAARRRGRGPSARGGAGGSGVRRGGVRRGGAGLDGVGGG